MEFGILVWTLYCRIVALLWTAVNPLQLERLAECRDSNLIQMHLAETENECCRDMYLFFERKCLDSKL